MLLQVGELGAGLRGRGVRRDEEGGGKGKVRATGSRRRGRGVRVGLGAATLHLFLWGRGECKAAPCGTAFVFVGEGGV